MIYTISNNLVSVDIATKGAELQSIVNKQTGLEYMWNADPAFWSKKSPVLFPIVGGLKNNRYRYNGVEYTLNRHGFARESEFNVTAHTADAVTFTLQSSEETLKNYPFPFIFSVKYTLAGNAVQVSYIVQNTGTGTMYFGVGGHPAFAVPVVPGTNYNDYYLEFSHVENAGRWPLDSGGQIEKYTTPVLNKSNRLPLSKPLFYQDALVFKFLQSNRIAIKTDAAPHGLAVQFDGFPYMGIWSFKDADFVCIEPWCGIADNVDADGELQNKEGINSLESGTVFERTWSVEVF